jgi:hypothetical protein
MLNWDMVKEYEYNLANLTIRSVRLDLDAPDLPVIIGELGVHGLHPTGRGADRVMAMRAAERRVTEQEEFKTTSLCANGTLHCRQWNSLQWQLSLLQWSSRHVLSYRTSLRPRHAQIMEEEFN